MWEDHPPARPLTEGAQHTGNKRGGYASPASVMTSDLKPKRHAQARRLSQASRWLLAVALAGAALAVGAVHTVTLCIVAVVLSAAAVAGWWAGDPMKVRSVATVLLLTGIGLTAFTAFQCVPMPVRWLAVIAPHNADVWSRALTPLHEMGPGWAPLSLDPIATRVEVLKGIVYLLAFVTALRIARSKEGVGFLSGAIVLTGLLLAVFALLHPAFGAHRLYGIYQPGPGIAERHIAPLMNPNNLAGYLNVAFCLALAATLAPEPRVPRALGAAVVLLLATTQVWVASRAGVVTMALGALVVIAITRIARAPRRGAVMTLSVVSGVAAAIGAALVVLGGSQAASSELLVSDTSKLGMFGEVMRMLPAVPLFGCGRGAFESAFAAFRVQAGYVTYTHPENVIAQWVLEWGLPVGVAGLAALAFALRPNVVLARSTTAAGAWAGLLALAIQNLADLGTEIPGLMLSGVVCAAIVVAGMPGSEPSWRIQRWAGTPRRVAISAVAFAASGVALGVAAIVRGELHHDEDALHVAAVERRVSVDEMHALARAAMSRHPAEPYLPYAVALRGALDHDDDPIPWIEATLERASVYGPAHLVLARVLATKSPSQARLEYRLAMEQAPEIAASIVPETGRLIGGYDDAMELVPPGKGAAAVLEALATSVADRLPATRLRLDSTLASIAPASLGPALRAAADAVADLAAGGAAPWCAGALRHECVREALAKAGRVQQLRPAECEGYLLAARVRISEGQVVPALTELERASDAVTDRVMCIRGLVSMANATGNGAYAERALDRLANAGCASDDECAANLAWVASQETARGNSSKAFSLYKRAYERAPDNDAVLEELANLAAASGLHAESAEDYGRLARRHPEETRWKNAAEKEREAAVKSAVGL